MANQIPRVRWLKNATLNVKLPSEDIIEMNFRSTSYMVSDKIIRYPDGYGDIYIGKAKRGKKQAVIEGIKLDDAIEVHGKIKIIDVQYTEKEEEKAPPKKERGKKERGKKKRGVRPPRTIS